MRPSFICGRKFQLSVTVTDAQSSILYIKYIQGHGELYKWVKCLLVTKMSHLN